MKKRKRSDAFGQPTTKSKKRQKIVSPSFVPKRNFGALDIEKKTADVDPANINVSLTGVFTLLCAPQLGTDFTNRIGRKLLIKSVYVRGYVASEGTNGATLTSPLNVGVQLARMIIFVDWQPNGAAPAVADLLKSAAVAAHLNLNNRDRFKIIADEQFVIDPILYNTTASSSVACVVNQIKEVKLFRKLNIETIFNAGNAGTIADISSGALYMFWIGAQAAGTSSDANAQVATRVRFTDL